MFTNFVSYLSIGFFGFYAAEEELKCSAFEAVSEYTGVFMFIEAIVPGDYMKTTKGYINISTRFSGELLVFESGLNGTRFI